jgi:type IV pilus assembly protein PilC
MSLFKYKAINEEGKRLEGEFSANSKNEVVTMIRENGYLPLKVEEKIQGKEIKFGDYFSKVKNKDLAVFCRQFSTLLDAGSDILNCIELLRKQSTNKKIKVSLDSIYEDIQKGRTLSGAMDNFTDIYPKILVNMIASGEETGQLSSVMERMAEQFERESRIESKIKGALIYPIILVIVSIAVIIFLLTFVMPTFVEMFESSGVELPGPTKALLGLSSGIKKYWYIVLIVIIGIVFGFRSFIKTDKGIKRLDQLKVTMPGIKNTNKKIITMRFSRGLATTLYSGVSMINAIEIVAKVVGNKLIEEKLMIAREKVVKGVTLNEALNDIEEFPPMLTAMVRIGEESGAIDTILDKTAKFYEQEVEEALQRLTTMIEPIMILIMGVFIGAIVIAMVMPMFDMFKTVT